MSDQDHIRRAEIERAHQARVIIESPLWVEVWNGFVENCRAHMESPTTADDKALEARRMLIVVQTVRREFETMIETGAMASIQLERSDGRNEPRR